MWSRALVRGTGLILYAIIAGLTGAAEVAPPPPRVPAEDARCAVCGMLVAPFPEWLAQLSFDDGSVLFFDGAKDLFTYLVHRDRYLPEKQELKVSGAYVIDYYSATAIPAASAFFVVGSDVRGPMGNELVAHADSGAAEEFCRDHHGRAVLSFTEIDATTLEKLD